MATFADTLSDDEVKSYAKKYGRDKTAQLLDMDENATDDQIKGLLGGGQTQAAPVPKAEGPGVMDRAWEGAKNAVPFLKSAENGFDYSGLEGAGRLAGDIGGTAATVAWGVPKTIGTAAGLGAAVEGSGIGQASRKVGSIAEQGLNDAIGTNLPSKVAGIEGLGTGINGLTRAPGAAMDVMANVLPYVLGGKAVLGESAAAAPKIAPVNVGADLLKQYGGKLSPAMQSGTKLTGALDWLAGKAFTAQNTQEAMRQANAGAIKTMLGEKTPLNLSEGQAGQGVKSAIEAYKENRGARFGDAERQALNVLGEGPEVGKAASRAIIDDLQKRGVPIDEQGFVPSQTPMTAKIDRPTASLLQALAQDLRGADAEGVINARRNLRANAPEILKAAPDATGIPARSADAAMKKALNRAIYDKNPEAGMKYADARREYAKTVEPVRRLTEAMAKENASPETFTQKALTPKQGTGNLEMFSKYMSPDEFKPLQEGLARAILQDSMNPQAAGEFSAPRLNTAMNQSYRHAMPYLAPEVRNALSNAQAMLETARIADTAVPQVSAGGNAMTAQTGALLGAGGLAMGGNPLPLLGLGAAEALAPLYLNSPQLLSKLPGMPQWGNAAVSGVQNPALLQGLRMGAQ